MRTIDLDLIRKPKGSFILNGKTYSVYEPTIGLLIQHSYELKQIQEAVAKEGLTVAEVNKLQNEWFVREVQIFVPSFKKEDAKFMSHEQRDAILSLVFGNEEVPAEKKTGKKKQGKKK